MRPLNLGRSSHRWRGTARTCEAHRVKGLLRSSCCAPLIWVGLPIVAETQQGPAEHTVRRACSASYRAKPAPSGAGLLCREQPSQRDRSLYAPGFDLWQIMKCSSGENLRTGSRHDKHGGTQSPLTRRHLGPKFRDSPPGSLFPISPATSH